MVRSEALLEAMDKGEGVIDQAPTHMETQDGLGDRIDGGPDGSALSVAMDGSHQLIELQEGAALAAFALVFLLRW